MINLTALALLPFFALSLSAQKTWKIPASQLPATITKARAGDVLLVSGKGSFFSLAIKKPLFIHGQTGAELTIWTGLTIENIPSAGRLVLQGFKISSFSTTALATKNCRGSMLISGVVTRTMSISNCSEVAIEGCNATTLTVQSSTVLVSGSTFLGHTFNPRILLAASPGLIVRSGTVLVADCSLTGGSYLSNVGSIFGPPAASPAIALAGTGTMLQLTGNTTCTAGVGPKNPVDTVIGTGQVVYDPGVRFVPTRTGAALAATLKSIQRTVPVTTITRAKIGEMATVAVRGVRTSPFVLFLGRPGAPFSIKGVLGRAYISAPAVVSGGLLDSTGSYRLTFRVPVAPVLRGIIFRWQAGTVSGGAAHWAHPATDSHD